MHNAPIMATPKPGEIRCPTCHRSTLPAAFCTQCGSPIPEDARARPRGMDRDELQDRIRQRRSPGDPYRRGGFVGDAQPGYERFEPDPQDAAAVRPEGGAAEGGPRADYFEDRPEPEPSIFASPQPPPDITHEPEPDRWEPRSAPRPDWDTPAPPPAAVTGAIPEEPSPWGRNVGQQASVAPQYAPQYEDAYEVDDDGYAYDDGRWQPPPRRGASAGGLAILGFLALGVLAIVAGAFLSGVFSGEDGVADQPTPTPGASVAATPEATPQETPAASGSGVVPSGSPGTQEGPVTFPDDAVFDVEPCASSDMDFEGCFEDGSTISGGAVWAWMGFACAPGSDEQRCAVGSDRVVLQLLSDGTVVDQQDRVLADVLRCPDRCNGYMIQGYSGLAPGQYEFVLQRNGEFADRASFTVEG
jgi:hypothetical protein